MTTDLEQTARLFGLSVANLERAEAIFEREQLPPATETGRRAAAEHRAWFMRGFKAAIDREK